MDCSGKTAVVAGGFGGIGYATCNSLLSKGVKNLGIFDLFENGDLLQKLKSNFPKANIKFWKVDATKKSEIENGFKGAVAEFKSIDIFVTSVGVVDEMNPERCVQINLLGTMNLNYVAIDYMSVAKGGKGGLVANVASLSGIVPFPLCVAYCATKHGIVGLTRSLGSDFYLKTTGMKFVSICPGFTETPLLGNFAGSPVNNLKTDSAKLAQQTAETCGELLVEALEKDKNGSIWMIDAGKMKEIIPPEYYSGPTGT